MIADENSRSTDDSSSSSMKLHYSSDDLVRNNEEVSPISKSKELRDKLRSNKLRKLLSSSGHTTLELPALSKGCGTVDLTEKSDDNSAWLQTKFAINNKKKRRSGEDAKKSITGSAEKKKLLTSIALKRKEAQDRRKEMYNGDNEDVFSNSEPEEEEYESDVSDKSDEQHEQSISPEKSPIIMEEPLTVDASTTEEHLTEKIETVPNLFNPNTFPSSLSQWCDSSDQKNENILPVSAPFVDQFTKTDDDELLMLCSGNFEGVAIASKANDADEDVEVVRKKRGARVIVDSDDEDETSNPKSLDETPCDASHSMRTPAENEELDESNREDIQSTRKRVVISDDEEDDENLESSTIIREANEEDEDENSIVESEEEMDESVSEAAASNIGDSDDELAVIKRLENKEYKKKSRSSKFFDDEASLSGDDIGSDEDADLDGEDAYEREEGDDDDVPDDKVIALENNRRLLKEEQDKAHREIAKLQERLLPDGDLSAVQTNRSFRVRLREDLELPEEVDGDGNEEDVDDADDDDNEEEHKSRIAALKLRLEIQERMTKEVTDRDQENSNDPFEFAANIALSASTSLQSQKVFVPSLLNRAPLANAFKDMSNAVTAKQLYTRTENATVNKRPQTAILENTAKKAKPSVLASIED